MRSKRDEFWDTAPAFEGKAEIWAALKAAVDAATREDQVWGICLVGFLQNSLVRYRVIFLTGPPLNLISVGW